MSRDQGRILAALIGVLGFIITAVIQQQDTFGISKQVTAALVIVNGALFVGANYFPNVFRSEPAPLPGNPTGAPNP
jgi:hypothetical protein